MRNNLRNLLISLVFVVGTPFSVSAAEPFGFGAGWVLPQTTATTAVFQALSRGLCEQQGVDYINSLGVPAANSPAGSWPINRHQLFWYGKGNGCDGKFEFVAEKDGGGDEGYRQGWEISWEPSSYVPGVVAGLPVGDGTQHPTKWRFVPLSQWDPTVTPTPITPPPSPITPPSLSIDYSSLLRQILEAENALLESQRSLLIVEQDTNRQVGEMNRTLGDTLKSISAFVGKYISPAVAGWLIAKHVGS